MAEKTEINYDQLENFMRIFETEQQEIQSLTGQTRSMVGDLHGGGWVGRGADKFVNEMAGEVIPAMNRLSNALLEAKRVVGMIYQIFNQAEEETQGYFKSLGD